MDIWYFLMGWILLAKVIWTWDSGKSFLFITLFWDISCIKACKGLSRVNFSEKILQSQNQSWIKSLIILGLTWLEFFFVINFISVHTFLILDISLLFFMNSFWKNLFLGVTRQVKIFLLLRIFMISRNFYWMLNIPNLFICGSFLE